jgi:hypothetical protein
MNNPREYGGFSRKLGVTYMLPSVHIIDKRLTGVQCGRVFRHRIPLLNYPARLLSWLPLIGKHIRPYLAWLADEWWWYKWQFIEGDVATAEGYFVLVNPSSYFDLYDTRYLPMDDAGISSLWHWTIAQIAEEEDDDLQWWTSAVYGAKAGENASGTGIDPAKIRNISGGLSRPSS